MDNILKIINYLGKHIYTEFTMHELSRILKIPYATFYRTIMKNKDLLIINKVGKSKTITLNTKNPIIQSYLTIASDEEKKEYIKKKHIIRIISKEIKAKDIVLLFGSYAKGEEREKSDIDMMVINKSGERTISFSQHETLFRREINPMFIKEREFIMMLKEEDENVGKQALKDHIILNNPKRFWEVVLNAI